MHVSNANKNKQISLFESSWKRPYSDRGIRKMLEKYSEIAGMSHTVLPHKLRHFLFSVDDALIQPYSGHETFASLEVYSKLSLSRAQEAYDEKIKNFPV